MCCVKSAWMIVLWCVCQLCSGLPAVCVGLYCLIVYLVFHYVNAFQASSLYGDVTGTRDM